MIIYVLWILVLPVPSEWFQKTISDDVSYVSSRLYPMFHWVHGTWRNNNLRSVRLLKPGTRVLVFAPRYRPDDEGAEAASCTILWYLFADQKMQPDDLRVGWRPPQQFQGLILRLWWIYSNVFCNFLTWSFSEHVVTWKKKPCCASQNLRTLRRATINRGTPTAPARLLRTGCGCLLPMA